jgi:hypothetical protein
MQLILILFLLLKILLKSLKPLIVDGDFGAKSVSTLIVIMGKSSASYNEVRDKRIQFSKNYGLGNPYSTK